MTTYKNDLSLAVSKLIATLFYSGYIKPAPGTWGSILALLIGFFINRTFAEIGFFICGVLSFILYWIGISVIKNLTPYWGDDPQRIVIDEAVAIWMIIGVVQPLTWLGYAAILVTFRIFDITKILGISYFDKMKNPHGVMLDDVIAGVYSIIAYIVIHLFFPIVY